MIGGTAARAHGGTGRRSPRAPVPLCPCARFLVPLCLCASVITCTDPRARPAPPAVRVYLAPGVVVRSPGTIAVSAVVFDVQGVDSVHMTLKSTYPGLQGDSLYLVADTTDYTQSVLWSVPAGVPAGTTFTLGAKAWNLLGFAGADSTVATSQ